MSAESCENCGEDVTNTPQRVLCDPCGERCIERLRKLPEPTHAQRALARSLVLYTHPDALPQRIAEALRDEAHGAEVFAAEHRAMRHERDLALARLRRAVGILTDLDKLREEVRRVLDDEARTR